MSAEDSKGPSVDMATGGGAVRGESVAATIEARITAMRAERGDTVPLSEVGEVVTALLESVTGDLTAEDVRLYHEIEDLARYIHSAKAEIAALNPADIREEFLPTAADELDAIVQSTEAATGEIMDATEALEDQVDGMPADAAAVVRASATRIYEACSFQDITGQRVTKVVRTLKSIEDRVEGLVRAFDPERHGMRFAGEGGEGEAAQKTADGGHPKDDKANDKPSDEDLLNGPQDAGQAIKQDDVDALLARFD